MIEDTVSELSRLFFREKHIFDKNELSGIDDRIDFRWSLYESDIFPFVFRGSCMKSMPDLVHELYAVLQLQRVGNSSFNSMYDDLFEFDHWVKEGKYLFVFLDANDILKSHSKDRATFFSVMAEYFLNFEDTEHFPGSNRKIRSILL